jgi:hypothetical protein
MAVDKSLLDAMGVTAERLFGYVYAGVATFVAAWLIQPDPVQKLAQAVGSLVFLVLLVTVGGVVFAVYFRILGGMLLFPLTHKLHQIIDRSCGRRKIGSVTSSIFFLQLVGVRDPEAEYVEVKDSFAPQSESAQFASSATETRFHFAHCEVNFFYLTAIVSFAGGVIVSSLDLGPGIPWFAVAACSYLLAVVADIRVHTFETTQMRNALSELESFLRVRHFLTQPQSVRTDSTRDETVRSRSGQLGAAASP